jgi:hypothetical protein
MNKSLGSELIVYSVLLAALSYLAYHMAPAVAGTTRVTGLVGGALCLVWGLLAVLGKRRKVFSVLTLIPVCYVLLGQAIMSWTGRNEGDAGRRLVPVLIAVMFVISMGMLMAIAYHGTLYGQPPGQIKEQPGKPRTDGKSESKPDAIRRA